MSHPGALSWSQTTNHIFGKRGPVIVFRQKFYQNLACGAHFQFSNHDLYEKVVWKLLFENCLLFFIFNFTCYIFFAFNENNYTFRIFRMGRSGFSTKRENWGGGSFPESLKVIHFCWMKISHIGNPTYWEKRYLY